MFFGSPTGHPNAGRLRLRCHRRYRDRLCREAR